jgi:Ca2+-binding EF-hand superfamily protein
MSNDDLRPLLEKFDELAHAGSINLANFRVLMAEIVTVAHEQTADLYFDGIDIERSNTIGKEDFRIFAVALLQRATDYSIKLLFRALDKNRLSRLDAADVTKIAECLGRPMDAQTAADRIESITGSKTAKLNYAEIVKVIMNKDIDPNTDPYDGKVPKKDSKSTCCLLL